MTLGIRKKFRLDGGQHYREVSREQSIVALFLPNNIGLLLMNDSGYSERIQNRLEPKLPNDAVVIVAGRRKNC